MPANKAKGYISNLMDNHWIVGDVVDHPEYGIGEIVEIKDNRCYVSFDDEDIDFPLDNSDLPVRLHFSPGRWVRHRAWEEGIIKEKDGLSLVIDFNKKQNHRMSISIAKSSLDVIPEDTFTFRYLSDPDGIKKYLFDDPVNALIEILKEMNGKSDRNDLQRYIEKIIGENKWKNWWGTLRLKLKDNPRIRVTGGTKFRLELLDDPIKDLIERCLQESLISSKIQIAEDCFNLTDDADTLNPVIESFYLFINGSRFTLAERLAGTLYIKQHETKFDLSSIYTSVDDPDIILSALEMLKHTDAFKIALKDIFSITFSVERNKIAQTLLLSSVDAIKNETYQIISSLPDSNKILGLFLDTITNNFNKNPQGSFYWIKQFLYKKQDPPAGTRLFYLLDTLLNYYVATNGIGGKLSLSLLEKIRNILTDNELLISILEETDCDDIQLFADNYIHMSGLEQRYLEQFISILAYLKHDDIVERFSNISTAVSKPDIDTIAPEKYYMTEETHNKITDDLNNLIKKELPETSERIKIAKAHGDLKENSEYHAARHHHKVLSEFADELQDKLIRATIVKHDNVMTDKAGFGTRVALKNLKTGEISEYTILGPEDSGVHFDVISFMSPLSKEICGKGVGDEFKWRGESFLLESIKNAL